MQVPDRGRIDFLLRSRGAQLAAMILAFVLVAFMQRHNDGLWFQGDSPRHAINGFFWWDLLQMRPSDPLHFALSYYARYPVVNPIAYPPLFYLLEGLAYRVIAPSPYAAKLVVLGFAFLAGAYTVVWSRRWIGAPAGWTGAFLAFVPGVVIWSNTVMLNMPAVALGLACLYHFRGWLESGRGKDLALTSLFVLTLCLTYYLGAIAICVCIAWAFWRRSRSKSWWRKSAWIAIVTALAVIPLLIATGMAPLLAARNLPGMRFLTDSANWTFYWAALPRVLGAVPVVFGAAGIAAGFLIARWRLEAAYVASWTVVLIVSLTLLPARNERYILLAAPALVIAAAIGIACLLPYLPALGPAWKMAALAIGMAAGFWSTTLIRMPRITGFREVVSYLQQHAPNEPVLYDGHHDGLFVYYTRVSDPHFERRIVLAAKLMYHYGPASTFNWVETATVHSTGDVVNVLRTQSGCRWLAIEVGSHSEWSETARLLRKVLAGPGFELVRSFPVHALGAQRVDLYRLVEPVRPVTAVELSFPSYSRRTFANITPITR